MPVVNRIAGFAEEMAAWRQHLHLNPEHGFDCHETARFVVEKLKDFGVSKIHTGIATSGVIAIIEGRKNGPTIGLRADMDALPLTETSGVPWSSQRKGLMHACGHDGHTVMLLGAAKYLAETRNFCGRVALIFQPAEENYGGAAVMVQEGIMDRFDISEVYAIHNTPGTKLGNFYTKPGPIMAGADVFHVDIKGEGGHGAYPHETSDPVMSAVAIAQAFQSIVSRNVDPTEKLVISVTQIHTGTIDNIIPDTAYMNGTVRTFDEGTQSLVKKRMAEIVIGHGQSFGVEANLRYEEGYPPTINNAEKSAFAIQVAEEIAGEGNVNGAQGLEMGAEDFSYMLNERPGAYLFLGIGEAACLHNPNFDFNDSASPYGASFFARLVETAQPLT
ncbi:MAG: amidohydrolase [Rhodobacteraceae bacterium]|nr:amidohydrolase [Paracoccaceae bacterium]